MKRIEDIKNFEDIDTYYEISEIVNEVFQDRVEAHKHLVTANKEIERLNKALLDIKEYTKSHFKEMVADEEAQVILDIVNKALGSDKE